MDILSGRHIFDISPTLNAKIAVFPGDVAFRETFHQQIENGHNITLSSIETTLHLGAHTDGPNHYALEGESIDQRDLQFYIGTTQVIEVDVPRGERVQMHHLANIGLKAKRVLFKTQSFPDPYNWNNDFVALSSDVIEFLAGFGVILVGIDTPSIDLADDKILESHKAVYKNNMAILEGIVLKDVKPGVYQLIALPLKIEGADASPVRAVLIS